VCSSDLERFENKRKRLKQHQVWSDEDLFPGKILSDSELSKKKQNIIESFTDLSKEKSAILKIDKMNEILLKLNKKEGNNSETELK
jgi:hypothetical protein